jgi:hypothetical protein
VRESRAFYDGCAHEVDTSASAKMFLLCCVDEKPWRFEKLAPRKDSADACRARESASIRLHGLRTKSQR